jgi:hypothetical protein
MALSERVEIGSRDILVNGIIQVRTDTVIERDGVEISRSYHRHILLPGDSIVDEDPSVQRIALAEHTQAKIAAYKLAQEDISG